VSEHNDERLISAILASGVKIPPMPVALMEVLNLERDDDAGPREYAEAISRDPGMTGAVFRVAGSPVMGLHTKVDSLEKAITLLGLRTTVGVARSESLRSALDAPELTPVMNKLWARANRLADLALGTARVVRLRGVREDLIFQAGIFHDCGVAVLCRRDRGYAGEFLAAHDWPDLIELDARHAVNHAMVGLMVARNWQLPNDVGQAIRHHHERHPENLPEAVRALCTLIQFASHLLAQRGGGADGEWDAVWKAHAEALFRNAGLELAEVEEEMLSLSL